MIAVCFVCLGNICRSPTAEGVFRSLVAQAGLEADIRIDSAGTGAYHVGESPDRRARATAQRRGVKLAGRGRQLQLEDLDEFDYVVAMDRENLAALRSLTRSLARRRKLRLLRDFDATAPRGADVPDPYYGGPRGFDDVFDMIEAACRGLLDHVAREHGLVR